MALVKLLHVAIMLLRIITVVILLALFIQYIEGFDRVIVVNGSDIPDDLISHDEDTLAASATGSGSGSYAFDNSCCIYGNCSCPSLYNALTSLTSSVLINITTDMVLSSIIPLLDLANITITGHNNPTVNCNNSGGLLFISCHNCTIEGVTWDECGSINITDHENYIHPVLQLFNSSNITIKNCTFQHSIGQAIVLSEITGDVNISHCNFISNKQYEGHGTAIYYSSNNIMLTGSPVKFMITGCNFLYNERGSSVVYFSHSAKLCEYLNLQNSIFYGNRAVPIYLSNQNLHISGNIEFHNNTAENGGGMFISDHSNVTFHKSATVNFRNNTAINNGGAIFLTSHSSVVFKEHHTYALYQCHDNNIQYDTLGGDQYLAKSFVTVHVTFYNNTANGFGQDIYAHNSDITVGDTATVTFNGTYVRASSTIYANYHSTITFEGNSTVNFKYKHVVSNGGVMFIGDRSTIISQGNSTVTFIGNSAVSNGGVMFIDDYSTITFQGNSIVTFIGNYAVDNGGVMFTGDHCTITFQGNSTVTFNDNFATNIGGVIYNGHYSTVIFQGNSTVTFDNNGAFIGGVMYTVNNFTTITFQGNSTVNFEYNSAESNGGIMYISDYSTVTFQGYSTVTCKGNGAFIGGVMFFDAYSSITFQGNSAVTFEYNNGGFYGGAIFIMGFSTITFGGNSTVTFCNNIAILGGAILTTVNPIIRIEGSSTVTFHDNFAYIGGAMVIQHNSSISIQGNSTLTCYKNKAYIGGAMLIDQSSVTIEGNSTVTFYDSQEAYLGGSLFIYSNSTITFKENSNVTFNNNAANQGGVMYIDKSSTTTFEGNSTVKFTNNRANGQGGVIYIVGYSTIAFKGNSAISFCKNKVDGNGGSLYVDNNSSVEFKENSKIMFNGNTADLGGSIFFKSSIIADGISFVTFTDNIALQDGGAIYLSDHSNFTLLNYSNFTFYSNRASDYGGAIYVLFKENAIDFNSSNIHFKDNTAGTIQNSAYINVQEPCDRSCLFHGVNITTKDHFPLATSPNKLTLYDTVKCINGNDTDCDTYYMNNIMLGQEVTLDACLLDYYDQPTEAAQFSITGMSHQDYNISGSKYISITCNRTTQGIRVIGNLHPNNSYNYTVNISLYVTRISESKVISVNLIVGLSQCHPGFWYSNEPRRCECYDADNIISCSGSNSTIKRGYWFGWVTGKSTVTSCPNDYCNFTCCEITNGIYHLSPVRANQCRPHRFGTACGNCEKGYTLSFDSPECVEVNKCTIGTVLVTTLSLLYWIAVVVAVFAMMYYKVAIGSLYAIVYYYSVVDILLNRVLFISNGLYTTVSIMSSFAKLTPQFLGRLCLVRNMSGIDQQFIHYVHPVVILFILIMISVLIRRSRRLSSFVSRGIIHFICFLLLLSYTSVASTSLLLMRPLTFVGIDKVYTYLSPDIEYFHDRHIAYVIIAMMLTIVFVIGFPLLLLLEPFLNSKINFIKIKPLLDQFQGCYKDKCRCFAGYYMICRLVIILLVIVKISDDFTTQYLLISSCALMQLIHVLVRPYISTIHNVFDGIILQLIVIISVLPIVEFVDNYDETFVLVIIYILVILPLISFVVIKIWINRNDIQKSFKYLINNCSHLFNKIPTNDPKEQVNMREFDIVVDDSMRKNAIIVNM